MSIVLLLNAMVALLLSVTQLNVVRLSNTISLLVYTSNILSIAVTSPIYELYISRVESVRLTTPSLISSILTLLIIAVLSVCISIILLDSSISVVILFMIQSSVKN